ncbi:L,D-transpeptidase [Aquincola sp. MAHUQ-54]|uniref:L,D-transpeptidase n=1 Tax=Aquincola agrisoli TaxID=3119538 RepID=A0AAW9QEP9_9BURK
MSVLRRPSLRKLLLPFRLLLAGLLAAAALAPPAARASADIDQAWRQIVATADHRGLPFAIVDKREAVITVFDAQGHEVGRTPVLLGLAPGDDSTPGVGRRAQIGAVQPAERTTPAGRFEAEPGRNLSGEPIVWLDYGAALAIHRLRPGPSRERRAQRLASPRLKDRRISLGCVVVPEPFYEAVIAPHLGRSRSVVYVLPESRPLDTVLPPAPLVAAAAATAE